jgi:hypothetical protein
MKPLWLLLLAVTLQSVYAQEVNQQIKHALTVEQCRADQRLWMSKLQNEAIVNKIDYKEFNDWFLELEDCRDVDPDNGIIYFSTSMGVINRQLKRTENFIMRHNLWNQFLAEDTQGCRENTPCKPQDKR